MEFWKTSVMFLAFTFLLSQVIFAEDAVKKPGISLQARYDYVACQVDYSKNSINNIVSHVPGTADDLNPYKSKLTAELSALKGYSNDKEFSEYVTKTLHPDLKDLSSKIKNAFKGKNVTKEARESVRAQFKKDRDIMADCVSKTAKVFAEAKISQIQETLDKFDKKISVWAKQGLNTNKMKSIVTEAQSKVISPLRSAISKGIASEIKEAINRYCIGSGCKAGYNFHINQKMEFARLEALFAYTQGKYKNLDQKLVDSFKSDMSAVKSTADSVGTSVYTMETLRDIQSNLKKASKDLNAIIKQARSGSKKKDKDSDKKQQPDKKNKTETNTVRAKNSTNKSTKTKSR